MESPANAKPFRENNPTAAGLLALVARKSGQGFFQAKRSPDALTSGRPLNDEYYRQLRVSQSLCVWIDRGSAACSPVIVHTHVRALCTHTGWECGLKKRRDNRLCYAHGIIEPHSRKRPLRGSTARRWHRGSQPAVPFNMLQVVEKRPVFRVCLKSTYFLFHHYMYVFSNFSTTA